jgi:hypothetical protein
MVHITQAGSEHIEHIIALNAFVQELHAINLPEIFKRDVDQSALRDYFESQLADKRNLFLIAFANDELVAYLWAQKRDHRASLTARKPRAVVYTAPGLHQEAWPCWTNWILSR